MAWTTLNFGKHKGLTLPQVLFKDPDWFFWAYENDVFEDRPSLKSESEDIYKKSRTIKVLDPDSKGLEVQYLIHRPTMSFGNFEIVPNTQPIHDGSSPAYRDKYINMRFPKEHGTYDKLGYKNFLYCMKAHLFGNKSAKMTKKRCEDFFSDPNNFK